MTQHRIEDLNALVDAGQIEPAIASASAALDDVALSPDERMALLELRWDGHNLRLELAAALADAQAMAALARRHARPALQAQAALAMSVVDEKQGRYPQSLRAAQRALRAARRSGHPLLVGRALERLSGIQIAAAADPASALKTAQQALAVFESLGDLRWQARAWHRHFDVLSSFGRTAEADRAAARALELARRCGSRRDEGSALNILTFHLGDMGERLALYRQALAAYDAAGNLAGRATIIGNAASTYMELGLFRRARRHNDEALALARRAGHRGNTLFNLFNLFDLEIQTRRPAAARAVADEAIPLYRAMGVTIWLGLPDDFEGRLAWLEGRHAAAGRRLDTAAAAYRSELGFAMTALANAGRAHSGRGPSAQGARRHAPGDRRAPGGGPTAQNGGESLALWWQHSRALAASGRSAEAREALAQAYAFLLETAGALEDEGLRRNYLGKRADNRAVVRAWVADARAQGLPQERIAAHLSGETSIKEPFERLVETGLRLNELKSEAELREFLVDEVTELSGADRVLLVFDAAGAGHRRLAAAPRRERSRPAARRDALARRGAPHTQRGAAPRTRRRGRAGAAQLPRRAADRPARVAGLRLCRHRRPVRALPRRRHAAAGHAGRAGGADARQPARRRGAGAQGRGTHRRGPRRAGAGRAARGRAGDHQQHPAGHRRLAGLPGHRRARGRQTARGAREPGHGHHLAGPWRARVTLLYIVEHGVRLQVPDQVIADDASGRASSTGAILWSKTPWPNSWPAAPYPAPTVQVLGAGAHRRRRPALGRHQRREPRARTRLRRARGAPADHHRLEPGRGAAERLLFDETQRLLKETEQRNAELAVINSIQQGMAGSLDFQGIVDLVGDKLRQVLKSEDVGIAWLDPKEGMLHLLYAVEHGQRLAIEPHRPPAGGSWDRLVKTRSPMVLNSHAEMDAAGLGVVPGTDRAKSILRVPVIANDEVLGFIDTEDHVRENAYGESEVRLLQTIASSMGVALGAARLFDETQRLLKETDNRAAELAVINGVQQGLAKKLDARSIYELVGERLRELFDSQSISIAGLDTVNDVRHYHYLLERGQRIDVPDAPIATLGWHLTRTGQPLLINQDLDDQLAALGVVSQVLPGTERTKSLLRVPVLLDGRVVAAIGLDNVDRENAFGDADVRLLTTLAGSMSVALESARLFEQTQSLLAQAEQRAAELATVNALGQALSAKIDLDELIRTVGEKMRETFRADIVYVALLDEAAQLIRFPYAHGDDLTPIAPGEGLTGKIIQTGQALLLNQAVDDAAQAIGATQLGVQAKSYLGVPITVRGRTIGVISVQSTQQEGRFTDGRPEPARDAGRRRRRGAAQRTAVRRGARRARRGRGRQRGQERVPGDDEPRDPHADERGDRHERPAAGHAADRRAARLRGDDPRLRRRAADDHQRHPRLLEDRGRAHGHRGAARSTCASAWSRRSTSSAAAPPRSGSTSPTCSKAMCRAAIQRRRHAAAPDPAEPAEQRGEVHRARRGRAERERARPRRRTRSSCTFAVRDTGIGMSEQGMSRLFQTLHPGRLVDDAQVRRHRAGPGDQQAAGRADGRHDVGRERRPGQGSTFYFTIRAPHRPNCRRPAGATSSARSPGWPASACWSSTTTRPTASVLALQAAKWGMQPRDTESPDEALRWLASGERFDLAILDMHMPEMDGIAWPRKARALEPEAAAGAVQLLGRREAADTEGLFGAYLTKPLRQSQLFDTLVGLLAHDEAANRAAPAGAKPAMDVGMAARHPLRILLAEDNVVNQKLALRLLQQMGYRADLASNGIEAIECVDRQPYDVVLMDVQMPEMDGLEASPPDHGANASPTHARASSP